MKYSRFIWTSLCRKCCAVLNENREFRTLIKQIYIRNDNVVKRTINFCFNVFEKNLFDLSIGNRNRNIFVLFHRIVSHVVEIREREREEETVGETSRRTIYFEECRSCTNANLQFI